MSKHIKANRSDLGNSFWKLDSAILSKETPKSTTYTNDS